MFKLVTTESIQKTLLELRIVLCLSLLWMGSKVLSNSCMIAMSFNQKGNMCHFKIYIRSIEHIVKMRIMMSVALFL
ncbi:hypothetical protein DWY57_19200 [Bacteroides sp. AF25-5LB]|nr:hypothetical protein DWY57_19200 [Bacteroides sp. AF25-5LB]